MDNRERMRRDGSLGFSVPGLVLPNVIRIENEEQATAPVAQEPEPMPQEPAPEPAPQEPPEPTPQQPAPEPAPQQPAPEPAPPLQEVFVVADAMDTIDIVDTPGDASVLTTVQTTESLRVCFPPFEFGGETWAKVQAFASPTGAIAIGYARLARDGQHLIHNIRF